MLCYVSLNNFIVAETVSYVMLKINDLEWKILSQKRHVVFLSLIYFPFSIIFQIDNIGLHFKF